MPLKKRNEPIQLDVTQREHFIASQAGAGRKLFGTDPSQQVEGQTNAERIAIGQKVLEVLRDPALTPADMIDRLRETEAMLEDGKFTQAELEEVGGPTKQDMANLTKILGAEPDDTETFVYMVTKHMAEQKIAEDAAAAAAAQPLKRGLGAVAQVASSYDPDIGAGNIAEIDMAVEEICAFASLLTQEQAQRLYINLRHSHNEVGIGQAYGADFDVSAEIGEQITVVKAMRARLIDEDGKLTERFSAKEAKEILGASNALNQTIMKFQKEITNFQRLIMVENAVKAALDTLPREAQEAYMVSLNAQLENANK